MLRISRRHAAPRGFHYEPRYYDEDEQERKRRRIRIQRPAHVGHRRTRQPAFIAVGLLLLVVFYLYTNIGDFVENASAFSRFFFGS